MTLPAADAIALSAFRERSPDAPTLANGKICHVEIPALDVERSAEFYRGALGWTIGRRGDGGFKVFVDESE